MYWEVLNNTTHREALQYMYYTYIERYYVFECNTNCQALHFRNYVLGGTTTCPGPEIRRYGDGVL